MVMETPDFIKEYPAASDNSVCLADAILFDNGSIIINSEKCIKCGLCSYRCPEKKLVINEFKPELNDSSITDFFRKINKLKKNNPNFPNLIARNLLITLGYKASILKKGVTAIRTDIVGSDFIGEIEFGEDILETPRSILDDVAVLTSRFDINFKGIKTLIIIDK